MGCRLRREPRSCSQAYRATVNSKVRSTVFPGQPPCLTGLTTDRLSEVRFIGGSVDDLDRCTRERAVVALRWSGASWLLYAPDAPAFLSRRFRHHFADGILAGASLITATTGQHTTDSQGVLFPGCGDSGIGRRLCGVWQQGAIAAMTGEAQSIASPARSVSRPSPACSSPHRAGQRRAFALNLNYDNADDPTPVAGAVAATPEFVSGSTLRLGGGRGEPLFVPDSISARAQAITTAHVQGALLVTCALRRSHTMAAATEFAQTSVEPRQGKVRGAN